MFVRSQLALVLLVLVACAGCGKKAGTPELSGKVTLNGEDLAAGQVTAYNEKGEVIGQASITDGTYAMSGLPSGQVTLVVQTHQPGGLPINAPAQPAPRPGEKPLSTQEVMEKLKKENPKLEFKDAKPVPLKYTQVKTTDLKANVTAGKETKYDITMTGKGEIPLMPSPPLPK